MILRATVLAVLVASAGTASAHDFKVAGPSAGQWAMVHGEIAKGWATGEGLTRDHTRRFTQKTCLARVGGVQIDREKRFAGSITSDTIVVGPVLTVCQ